MPVYSHSTRPKLGNIQALRGLAALLVVISHLWVIERKYAGDQILGQWADLGMVGVDIFFVISGFIMVYVTNSFTMAKTSQNTSISASNWRQSLQFLYARLTRIYPLYWLTSLALLAVFLVAPHLIFSSVETSPNLVKSFALWPDTREPLLAVGWTLIHEIAFYFIFAGLLLFQRRFLWLGLLVWMIAIFNLPSSNSPVIKLLLSPLNIEFIFGCGVGFLYGRFTTMSEKIGWMVLGLTLSLWAITFTTLLGRELVDGASPMIISPMGRAIHFTLPTSLLVYGLVSLRREIPLFLQKLGDWSYALYLSHVLTLSLIGNVWAFFAIPTHIGDNIVMLLLCLAASIFVAAILHYGFEKPILRRTKKWGQKIFKENHQPH